MLEMTVDGLRVEFTNPKSTALGKPYVLMLKEKASVRYLPIYVGSAQADALRCKLLNRNSDTTEMYELLSSILSVFGIRLESVVINDFKDNTLYAKLILNRDGRRFEIDCRPSDAITLTLNKLIHIYVENEVLEKAGIIISDETKQ